MSDSPGSDEDPDTLFRLLAADYDEAIRRYQPTYDAMLSLSTDLACVAAPGRGRCLDFGAGTGAALPLLARGFDDVVAVEPGAAMLDLARGRVARECGADGVGRVTFLEGTVAAPEVAGLAEASFDAVHCSLVLVFVREEVEKAELLRFFHRILRTGGALVLTELVAGVDEAEEASTFGLWRDLMRHRGASDDFVTTAERQVHATMHRRTPEGIRALLGQAGFLRLSAPYRALHTETYLAFR